VFGIVGRGLPTTADLAVVPVPGSTTVELGGGRYRLLADGTDLVHEYTVYDPALGAGNAVEAAEFAAPSLAVSTGGGEPLAVEPPAEPRLWISADRPPRVILGEFSTDGGPVVVTAGAVEAADGGRVDTVTLIRDPDDSTPWLPLPAAIAMFCIGIAAIVLALIGLTR